MGRTDCHRAYPLESIIQLAGHLAAVLAVAEELRAQEPSAELGEAAGRLTEQVARLRWGSPLPGRDRQFVEDAPPARTTENAHGPEPRFAALHRRAHALTGRALVVASREDTAAAILTAERMDAHTAALAEPREPVTSG
ncbi:SCO4983 family protein [Streptomyces cyslabdanicus]|uniref:SCO4983 family protein n=1 Tax=Streptomyces cyslabdanicus TaxID=1470456 RepID=UPI0040440B94